MLPSSVSLPAGLPTAAPLKKVTKPEVVSMSTRVAKAAWTAVKYGPVPVLIVLGFLYTKPKPQLSQLFLFSSSAK